MKAAAIGLAAGLALAGCGKAPAPPAPPAPEVTVQTVDSQPVPLELTYTARTVGSREVEVRARVGGIVLKRRYQEGSRAGSCRASRCS
jgi:membrane fusion protein (multidrug efflux system)